MLAYLTGLLVCQLIGEAIVVVLRVPLPGPVVGMALLLATLWALDRQPTRQFVLGMTDAANVLLRHLSLLFVPAGVGVVLHLALIRQEWVAITVGLVGSAIISTLVTAWVMGWLGPAAPTPTPVSASASTEKRTADD